MQTKQIKSFHNTLPLIDSIIDLGAEFFNTDRKNIMSKSRKRIHADPRRIILMTIKNHIAGATNLMLAKKFNMHLSAISLIVRKLNNTIEFNRRTKKEAKDFNRYVLERLPI